MSHLDVSVTLSSSDEEVKAHLFFLQIWKQMHSFQTSLPTYLHASFCWHGYNQKMALEGQNFLATTNMLTVEEVVSGGH